MENKRALFVMQRKAMADALVEHAKYEAQLDAAVELSFAMAALTAEVYAPAVMLMEIPESGPWKSADKCLAVCDVIKRQSAGCSIIILCRESDADVCGALVAAKLEQRIDDFLYYETSMKYLFSRLAFFAR